MLEGYEKSVADKNSELHQLKVGIIMYITYTYVHEVSIVLCPYSGTPKCGHFRDPKQVSIFLRIYIRIQWNPQMWRPRKSVLIREVLGEVIHISMALGQNSVSNRCPHLGGSTVSTWWTCYYVTTHASGHGVNQQRTFKARVKD